MVELGQVPRLGLTQWSTSDKPEVNIQFCPPGMHSLSLHILGFSCPNSRLAHHQNLPSAIANHPGMHA